MKYLKTFENQKGVSFMSWLLERYPDKTKWKNITEIDCSNQNLVNLDGIENLVNLKVLFCYHNQLTELNLEKLVDLKVLDCTYNKLTELNLENLFNLEELMCYKNQLTELNIENLVNLVYLDCSYNQLTELNLENLINNLYYLNIYNNKLPYNDLDEYNKWFEKTYPEKVAAKRYNL